MARSFVNGIPGLFVFLVDFLVATASERPWSAMSIVMEAEKFALRRKIQPTGLLILDTGTRQLREGFRSNASMLVLRFPEEGFGDKLNFMVPFFLDVLAVNLKVIVITRNLANTLEPFQNFRHKCILHISLERRLPTQFLNTLYWKADGSQRFFCVRSFDQLVFWRDDKSEDECFDEKTRCSTGLPKYKRIKYGDHPEVIMHAPIDCNDTVINAFFVVSDQANTQFKLSMLYRYSMVRVDELSCFSFIQWRDTDLSSLLKPFDKGVWVLVLVSTLTVAKLLSWLDMGDVGSIFAKLWLSFITAVDAGIDIKKSSQLIAGGSALFLTFFIAQIYKNDMMAFLLNPQVNIDCTHIYNCKDVFVCYSEFVMVNDLAQDYCLCSMSPQQRVLIKKPLHRESNIAPDFSRSDYYDQNKMYFQTSLGSGGYFDSRLRGQHYLVSAKTSSTIDRFFATGIVSPKRLEPQWDEVAKYRLSFRQAVSYENLGRYIDFNTTLDQFDMKNFRTILPIFWLSFMVVLGALSESVIATNWTTAWKNYEKQPPVGPTMVFVNVYVRSLGDFNSNDMSYSAQLTFRQQWHEPKLAYEPTTIGRPNATFENVDRHSLWTPDTFFTNQISGHDFQLMKDNSLVRVFPNGEIMLSRRLQLKLSCPMHLKYFPFDTQSCSIKMSSYGYTTEQIVYLWKKTQPIQVSSSLSLTDFTLSWFEDHYCTSKTNTGEYSCLVARFTLERSWQPYIIKVFIPVAMLVILAYMTTWIQDANARAILLSTDFALALVAHCVWSHVLPNTSYFKVIDSFLIISLIFIFGIVIKFAIDWSRRRTFEKNVPATVRDIILSVSYPIAYVLIVGVLIY
ncbi:uncharacterized protein LOC100902629 [Galendromus occidentalis]|uniref:Uncharacterized protein LOC100902629 n=1 Tax=Galendromus occidentalis TaxID=34638 RepID=A0AAJ6QQF3_9ACAR|nr:uncharacterized protein LOC100902629 [Galendromus occidentalis]